MSVTRDYTLAAIIGGGALIAAIFWPGAQDESPAPVEPAEETQAPEPEEPETPQPEEAPEPEEVPEPEAEEEAEPVVLLDWLDEEPSYTPAGELPEGSGSGVADAPVYAPGMRFPVEVPRAFPNTQLWRPGGIHASPPWNQCAEENYDYPWFDNFCETRGWSTPMCPGGTGHQGQDIRPPRCPRSPYGDEDRFWAVAADNGVISGISSHTVTLLADDGTSYLYLHLDPARLDVETGDTVARGERIGVIWNHFGATPTTFHLHFEIRQSVLIGEEIRLTPVPPYTSLIEAFERLARGDDADGDYPEPY
ncbi:MAG: M23 family metallopeptidase [Caulobacterales bacterium]|uniref:M23 family metallopeptidase n=1 Tax=Glycocaulis sp. TaxID=1969725 RepID=UPI003FA03807